jgi:hypothetical protein
LLLAGVIFSRYVTFHSSTSTTNEVSGTLEEQLLNKGKNKNPLVWIIFSGAIAVLIFAGFQGQLKSLTPIIVIIISTAFAFGFGFDKVLEATKKIQST